MRLIKSRAGAVTVRRVTVVPLALVGLLALACGQGSVGGSGGFGDQPDESFDLARSEFPAGPITIMVGADVGSGSDAWARAIAAQASTDLGVAVNVVNITSGDGLDVLAQFEATEKDGHTLLSISDVHAAAYFQGKTDTNPAADVLLFLVGNIAPSIIYTYTAGDEDRFSSWEEAVEFAGSSGPLKVASSGLDLDLEDLSIRALAKDFGIELERVIIADSARMRAAVTTGAPNC